jgi:hypothetical protein
VQRKKNQILNKIIINCDVSWTGADGRVDLPGRTLEVNAAGGNVFGGCS